MKIIAPQLPFPTLPSTLYPVETEFIPANACPASSAANIELVERPGLSQAQRRLPALDPASAPLDGRDGDDLLEFARQYAETARVRYFAPDMLDDSLDTTPFESLVYDTWPNLMEAPGPMAELETRSDNPPHLALFMAFLKLFGLAQEQLNAFTQRHLDFYYREVLGLQSRPAEPDQVHLTFELARNVAEYLLPAGSEFSTAPDAYKQPLRYQTAAASVVNRAGIAHLRLLHLNPAHTDALEFTGNQEQIEQQVYMMPTVPDRAADGSWPAFAPTPVETNDSDHDNIIRTPLWPHRTLGFVLAAPVLRMAEGHRRVKVVFTVQQLPSNIGPKIPVRVQFSGEKSWLEPPLLDASDLVAGSAPVIKAGLLNGVLKAVTKTTGSGSTAVSVYTYELDVTLPASELQAIVGFNGAVLDGGYAISAPVMRVLLPYDSSYTWLRDVVVQKVKVDVEVTGLRKTLLLTNDQGPLDPTKPFLPFGPVPVMGSTLRVSSPEVAAKALTDLRAYVPKWLGKPGDIDKHYRPTTSSTDPLPENYPLVYKPSLTEVDITVKNHLVSGQTDPLKNPPKTVWLFSQTSSLGSTLTFAPSATVGLYKLDQNDDGHEVIDPYTEELEEAFPQFDRPVVPGQEELLTITLGQDFGHALYPKLLADAAKVTTTGSKVPNAPYAPLAQALLLDYHATSGEVQLDTPTERLFAERNVRFFHQGPFGWAEEHAFLKDPAAQPRLLPRVADGNTFLLALRDVRPLDSVPLLFQVAEGTADVTLPVHPISWSVLGHNQWHPLTGAYAPADATQNLLTSGIIEFRLPPAASLDNTLLEPGYIWLRAEGDLRFNNDGFSSASRLLDIHPQAVLARFAEHGNDPAHYAAALPAGQVTQLQKGGKSIRAVHQPYPGFGGRPAESAAAFATRVSERLRHRQRAVTLWDYEHLVLERFPELAQVKCLPHTKVVTVPNTLELATRGNAPGYTTLAVMPHPRGANALTPLAPPTLLEQVRAFVQQLAGPQVTVAVINPYFQRLSVAATVQLYPGYSAAECRPLLNQAICAFLAPWTVQELPTANFGQQLYRSDLLASIEAQPYVDSVRTLTLSQRQQFAAPVVLTGGIITAERPWAILTAHPTHALTM